MTDMSHQSMICLLPSDSWRDACAAHVDFQSCAVYPLLFGQVRRSTAHPASHDVSTLKIRRTLQLISYTEGGLKFLDF